MIVSPVPGMPLGVVVPLAMAAAVGCRTVKMLLADTEPETATPVLLRTAESGKYVPVAVVTVPRLPPPLTVRAERDLNGVGRRIELQRRAGNGGSRGHEALTAEVYVPGVRSRTPLANPVAFPVH